MKQILLFHAFFIFLSGILFSQTSTIKGTAENMPDELVRVIVYSDNFSHIEKTLASAYTDESGQFNMQFDVTKSSYAMLSLGLKKGEFYLKPGAEYEFVIPFDNKTERTSVFDELPLYFILDAADDSLNEHLGSFNNDYNSFLLENNNRIYRSNDKSLITDFVSGINDKYGQDKDKFFQDYLHYSIGWLEWLSKKKNDKQIIQDYFAGKPILYSNIQYADFFTDFFKNLFGSSSLFSYDDLVGAINSGRGFVAVDRLIAREETLGNDPLLREVIGVLLIARKYHSPEIKKKNVMSLLNEIKRNSKSAENGLIAGNTMLKLKNLAYGTLAPPFSLNNQNGEKATLSQFHGQFILLYFTRSNCKLCTYYFQNLDQLRKEFNGNLEIITIATEDGFGEIAKYAQTRSYEWPVLNLEKDILLLEKYAIRTFPSIVLINPNATIASANAPMPDEGLSLYIKRYVVRYEKRYPPSGGE